MVNLNDVKIIGKYDRSGMLEAIESFPEQCADAEAIGHSIDIAGYLKCKFDSVVFTGMGGSAIGADIVRSYTLNETKIPIFINRNYTLPEFVNKKSLVVVSSYSGNTEESLSAYRDARRKKAKIVAITSGGELRKAALRDHLPSIIIPGGFPPRCALGYSLIPPIVLLSKLGIVQDKSASIKKTIEILKYLRDHKLGENIKRSRNVAKQIAERLYLKFPVIYSGADHMDAVATRWRGQFEENAKTLSSSHVFPEMNHNEIMGWENPKTLLRDLAAVILRDSQDHPRVAKRMDITKELIEKTGVRVVEVSSAGRDLLARIFSLIYIGDFTSFYLAILNRLDPTPVERIAYLKRKLAQ